MFDMNEETVNVPAEFRRMLFEGCDSTADEQLNEDSKTGYEDKTEPIDAGELLYIVKSAMKEEAPYTQFRWANPEDYGNGSQPLSFDRKTGYSIEGNVIILGGLDGRTMGEPWPFSSGMLEGLKSMCQKAKKKLSSAVKGKTIGVKYYGKDVLPVVGYSTWTKGSQKHYVFWVRRPDPKAPEKKLDDDWI